MQETFTTILENTNSTNVWIYGINEYLNLSEDNDIDTTPKITVHWTFGIDDAREWGIKDFLLRIDKVIVDIDYSYTDEENKDQEGNVSLVIKHIHESNLTPQHFKIINNMELHKDKGLCPENVEIDLSKNRSIEIS